MQEIIKNSHISEEMWIALKQDTLDTDAFMQVLEHTGTCTWCAERLANVLEGEAFMPETADLPPAYLSGQILDRVKQLDVQAQTVVKQTSRKFQLWLYSMKVGAAVAFSLLLLGVTANFREMGLPGQGIPGEKGYLEENRLTEETKEDSLLQEISRAADGVTMKMNEFANLLLNGGK